MQNLIQLNQLKIEQIFWKQIKIVKMKNYEKLNIMIENEYISVPAPDLYSTR